LQNKEEFIYGWQQLHLDPKNCSFDVPFITWIIQRKDIDLGWIIAKTGKYVNACTNGWTNLDVM
jgi:hypothetical protein